MKYTAPALLVAFTIGFTADASAQGTINFANTPTTLVQYIPLDSSNPTPVPPGTGFVQLLWAATGTPLTPYSPSLLPSEWLALNPGWSLSTPSTTAIGPGPGLFSGGTVDLATATSGASIDGVVACWLGSYPTLDEAMVGGGAFAFSGRFTLTTGLPSGPATDLTAPGGFTGMAFPIVIPEPTVWALCLVAVFCFRIKDFRRKAQPIV